MHPTPSGYAGTILKRVDALRDSLIVEVGKIRPQAGDMIIVRPKNNDIAFPAQYIQWVADTLSQVYPNNQIMVLPDNLLNISLEKGTQK